MLKFKIFVLFSFLHFQWNHTGMETLQRNNFRDSVKFEKIHLHLHKDLLLWQVFTGTYYIRLTPGLITGHFLIHKCSGLRFLFYSLFCTFQWNHTGMETLQRNNFRDLFKFEKMHLHKDLLLWQVYTWTYYIRLTPGVINGHFLIHKCSSLRFLLYSFFFFNYPLFCTFNETTQE